jgi:glutamate racemase
MVEQKSIGVFDSGVGGLTVLAALQRRFPQQSYIYLGDTARLPYGTKSGDTVTRYALQAARHLVAQGIGTLVVACNTASAQALPALREAWPDLPIIGVIEAGAQKAASISLSGCIAVLSTEGTARTGAYVRAIQAHRPEAQVISIACSLLVALAEEGWHEGEIAESILRRYLGPVFDCAIAPDTIVLGCTHFPLLAKAIRNVAGDGVTIIDSGDALASQMSDIKGQMADAASMIFHVTDGPERFALIASRFLGHSIAPEDIRLVEL